MIHPRSLVFIMVPLGLLGSAVLVPLRAQELPRSLVALRYAPAEDSSAHRVVPTELVDSTSHPPTYWLEGALIVGVPIGILSSVIAGHGCSDPDSGGGMGPCWDNALLGGILGFGAGASFGALVGGQIKKGRKE